MMLNNLFLVILFLFRQYKVVILMKVMEVMAMKVMGVMAMRQGDTICLESIKGSSG